MMTNNPSRLHKCQLLYLSHSLLPEHMQVNEIVLKTTLDKTVCTNIQLTIQGRGLPLLDDGCP